MDRNFGVLCLTVKKGQVFRIGETEILIKTVTNVMGGLNAKVIIRAKKDLKIDRLVKDSVLLPSNNCPVFG